jgi:uncharacterized protein YkwD
VNADTPATRASTQAMRNAIVCLVNRERVSRKLHPLNVAKRLDNASQGWTNWMVANSTLAHVANGSDPGSRVSAAGYNWSSVGENIATGYATPRATLKAWMASTGHCQNMLNPSFADIGTGVSPHPIRGFASGAATWTNDFGLTMGHSAPSGNYGPANGCPY